MSIERLEILESGKDDMPLYIVGFAGGLKKGPMLQVSQKHAPSADRIRGHSFITLTKSDAEAVMIDIINWLNGE